MKRLLPFLIALLAALVTQITHEGTHAVAMQTVASGVEVIQLFAVKGNPIIDRNDQLIVSGSAAIVNIIVGVAAVGLFYLPWVRQRALLRLFVMFLAAYMLQTGFGYFMIDALFYAPDADFFPDWQYVIHMLGGGWNVRLPLLIVGVLGLLGVFFWLPPAALRFVSDPTVRATRIQEMLALTMIPYIAVNALITALAFSHPLGGMGVVLAIFQYWFGYIALFWAFFIGGHWTEVKTPFADATLLPQARFPLAWAGGLAVLLAVTAWLAVGVRFTAG
ncbi:MAG: hypothetical protein ACOYL5_03925 [Phototrophicaceae bacterium]|jgi:hypothetical protein